MNTSDDVFAPSHRTLSIGILLSITAVACEGMAVTTIMPLAGVDLGGLDSYGWAFSAFMWSLAGIPPFFGFWPKLVVFRAAIASGYVVLAVAGILGTVIGAYYYMKIIKVMFMDEPAKPFARARQPVQAVLILIAAIAISPLGYLLIESLGSLTDRAAGSLF